MSLPEGPPSPTSSAAGRRWGRAPERVLSHCLYC